MKIEEQNIIKWKNGSGANDSPTYFNADNLNKINEKTAEAINLLSNELDNKFNIFETRLTDPDADDPIIVAEAVNGTCDKFGRPIDLTYITKEEQAELIEKFKTGETAVGEADFATEAITVTGSIGGQVQVQGDIKDSSTKDKTVATTEFVTKVFNEVINDALE